MSAACTARRHGTTQAYRHAGCRCLEAREAMRPIWREECRRIREAQGRWTGRRSQLQHRDVDEVAVYRAVQGHPVPLGVTERHLAIAELDHKLSAAAIAARIGCTERTVQRHRSRLRAGSPIAA